MTNELIRSKVVDLIKPSFATRRSSARFMTARTDAPSAKIQADSFSRPISCALPSPAKIQVHWLIFSEPPILVPEDYTWVVAEVSSHIEDPQEAVWAAAAAWLFAPERCDIEEMFELRDTSSVFESGPSGG